MGVCVVWVSVPLWMFVSMWVCLCLCLDVFWVCVFLYNHFTESLSRNLNSILIQLYSSPINIADNSKQHDKCTFTGWNPGDQAEKVTQHYWISTAALRHPLTYAVHVIVCTQWFLLGFHKQSWSRGAEENCRVENPTLTVLGPTFCVAWNHLSLSL